MGYPEILPGSSSMEIFVNKNRCFKIENSFLPESIMYVVYPYNNKFIYNQCCVYGENPYYIIKNNIDSVLFNKLIKITRQPDKIAWPQSKARIFIKQVDNLAYILPEDCIFQNITDAEERIKKLDEFMEKGYDLIKYFNV